MKVIADGWVCDDCIMMMANGEISPVTTRDGLIDDDAWDARSEEVAQATAGWCCATEETGEHADLEFSMCACRTCRSQLGGSRFWAVKLG